MRHVEVDFAGEANDLVILDVTALSSGDIQLAANPAWTPVLYGVWLSAQEPSFDWTLFWATAAGETVAQDIPILDSRADIPATETDTTAAAGNVVNRSMVCAEGEPIPRDIVANAPMTLRVTTFGKTTPGTIRVAWDWKRVP